MKLNELFVNFDRLPKARLGIWPTPLEQAHSLQKKLNHWGLYIKRDDLTGLGIGGNKTRSLEFLLGDALQKGANLIITAGGLQSNLCSLTAAACCKLGLGCMLVHNDYEPASLQGNVLLNSIFGAKPVFLGKVSEREREMKTEELAELAAKEGKRPYIVRKGASTPLGSLGYVNAAFELNRQCKAMNLDIKHVAVVGAMGGTASGFVLGTALLGHPFEVHVISVEYPKEKLTRLMREIMDGALGILGSGSDAKSQDMKGRDMKSPSLKPHISCDKGMVVYDEYLGEGYGIPTPLSKDALFKLARCEGILSENVYTAKSFGGLIDLIEKGCIPPNEKVCFIHTGGTGSLFAQAFIPEGR